MSRLLHTSFFHQANSIHHLHSSFKKKSRKVKTLHVTTNEKFSEAITTVVDHLYADRPTHDGLHSITVL